MGALQRVDEARFRHAPFGTVHVGDAALVWADGPDLVGIAWWGEVAAAELERAARIWEALWPRLSDGVGLVIDVARAAAPTPEMYVRYAELARAQQAALAARRTRQLTLTAPLPTDIVRVMSLGFSSALESGITYFVTSDPDAGAAWLGQPVAAERVAEARALIVQAQAAGALLRRVREAIEADLAGADGELVARRVGMSHRALQRALAADGTSFRDEVLRARLDAAERLLRAGDTKVADVARQVGFESASHFASVFRRVRGASPQDLRRRPG